MTQLCIKHLAEQRGLNITTLSRRSELAYTTVHALWHATATQFSLKTLDRVACALDVQVSDLFVGSPDPSLLHSSPPSDRVIVQASPDETRPHDSTMGHDDGS